MGRRGFTLVEAAVAIAVMSILAGTMAPLAVKTLNRRRESATRRALQQAWEAMFGARDRYVPNVLADCNFRTEHTRERLAFLLRLEDYGGVPPMGLHAGFSHPWGFAGPYWFGDTQDGRPADAWGTPIRLEVTGAAGPGGYPNDMGTIAYQVRSFGPDKVPSDDDLVYPAVPVPYASMVGTLRVNITKVTARISGRMYFRLPVDYDSLLRNGSVYEIADVGQQVILSDLPPTGAELVLEPGARSTFPRTVLPLQLLPGERRDVRVSL